MTPQRRPDEIGTDIPASPLLSLLRTELRAGGRITFDRYMELALYHPEHGYYCRPAPPIGPEGDYYTSTDVSPLFGATLGRQLREMWLLLGCTAPFTVLEFGAGKGLLAADILGWAGAAHPDFFSSIDYAIVELSPQLRNVQRDRLQSLPVRWPDLGSVQPGSLTGCTLSNEVADALPFHRVQGASTGLRELWVTERDGGLAEEPGEPSSLSLQEYLDAEGVRLIEGQVGEINLRAPLWMRAGLDALRCGFAVVIDYGDAARELYGPARMEGTLKCYHRHVMNREPFQRIGEQDITADVNFTALARAAEAAGAQVTGYTSQAYFLAALGLGDALTSMHQRGASARAFERERAAIEELIRPDGLGGFRVLAVRKNVDQPALRGFSFGSDPLDTGIDRGAHTN